MDAPTNAPTNLPLALRAHSAGWKYADDEA